MNIETVTKILDCALSEKCDEVFDQNLLKKNLLVERVLCQSGLDQQYCHGNKQRVDEFEKLIQNIASYCCENDIRTLKVAVNCVTNNTGILRAWLKTITNGDFNIFNDATFTISV